MAGKEAISVNDNELKDCPCLVAESTERLQCDDFRSRYANYQVRLILKH